MLEVRRLRVATLRALPPGTPVCLVLDAPGSRWLLRALARRAGVTVDRELIVVPSTRSPLLVLDDAAEPVARLWHGVATVPPGIARGWWAATMALHAARRMPWQWTGAVLPGRVVIGRTS